MCSIPTIVPSKPHLAEWGLWDSSPQEFGAAPALVKFISVYYTVILALHDLTTELTLISNIMAKPGPMDLCLKTHPRAFPDPTFELTCNPVEGKHGPKPNLEPPLGLLNCPKPNLDSTELTLVECIHSPLLTRVDTSKGVVTPPKNNEALDFTSRDWARSSPESGGSPDSTASSLTRTAWKPGHLPHHDHSDLWLNEPKDVLKECPRSVKYTRPTYCDLTMYTSQGTPQDSHQSSGPATSVVDERARSMTNEPLTAEAFMDQECGQILQDTAAEIAKHYFISDPDPYKFDPGGVLAVHMEAGVPSEDKVLQLAALGLHWLCTGLKIIAQLQSVDESELVAYTTNSKAQGYATGVVNNPPRVISLLAHPGKEEHEIRTLWSIVLLVINPSSGPYNGTAKCLHWDGHTLIYCTSGPQTHRYDPWEPKKPLLPFNVTGLVGVYMTTKILLANGSEATDPQCDMTKLIKTPMARRVGIGSISRNSSPETYLERAPKLEPVVQDHTDAHKNGFRWKPGLGPSIELLAQSIPESSCHQTEGPRSSETTGLPYNATSPDETKECRYDMLRDLVEFLLLPRYTRKTLSQQDLELGTTVEDAEGEDPEPGMSRMVRCESGSHRNDAVLPPPQGDTIQRKGLPPSSLTSTRGSYSKLTERWLDSAIFHRRFLDAYLVTAMEYHISRRVQGPFDTFMSGFSQLIA
ncbi:hypothetical protein BS47DRAFT_1368789 [Hydnum rufescens UP504]|uniref:Uncharacterized protein n=1 Tax=Hydnum rufescens UP504 TaxID=1448309 RepID=A0A9P6AF46_9AGAM|nr:hypothetical protein BS47DRAFT_1368789 [Hydnum rufescens UP504]